MFLIGLFGLARYDIFEIGRFEEELSFFATGGIQGYDE